ncbi:MAG: hypothetical protein QW597_06380 [Thermoplasmataceae archaeon]
MTAMQNELVFSLEIALVAIWLAAILTYPVFASSFVTKAQKIAPGSIREVIGRISHLVRIFGLVNLIFFLAVELYPAYSLAHVWSLLLSPGFDIVLIFMLMVYPVLAEGFVNPSFKRYSVISAYREKNPEGKSFVHETVLEQRMRISTTISAVIAVALIVVISYFF